MMKIESPISLVVVISMALVFYNLAEQRPAEPCWKTIGDVKMEAWFQTERERLQMKFANKEPLSASEQENWDRLYHRETLMECTSFEPYQNTTYWRQSTKSEMLSIDKD